MKVALSCSFLAYAAAGAAPSAALISHATPEPNMRSDKTFMSRDFPDDAQPMQIGRVSENLPYPAVQSASTFEKDYVKDENHNKMDRATWDAQLKYARDVKRAQERYDRLVDKLAQEKLDVKKAEAVKKKEEVDYKKAKDKEEEAAKKTKAEEAKEEAALKKRHKFIGGKEIEAAASATTVEEATKTVQKEVNDLQACEEELRKAKQKLQQLQDQAKTAAAADAKAEDLKERTEELQEAAEEKEAALEKKVDEEKREYQNSEAKRKKEESEFKKLQEQLAKAEAKLRKYRQGSSGSKSSKGGSPSSGGGSGQIDAGETDRPFASINDDVLQRKSSAWMSKVAPVAVATILAAYLA